MKLFYKHVTLLTMMIFIYFNSASENFDKININKKMTSYA